MKDMKINLKFINNFLYIVWDIFFGDNGSSCYHSLYEYDGRGHF